MIVDEEQEEIFGFTEYQWTRTILQRVGSVTLGQDDPTVKKMMASLRAQNLRQAIEEATHLDSYYNITMRDIAAPMSNREGDKNTELNDFIATFVGVVRDDVNAKELLTGDFFYVGKEDATNKQNLLNDIIKTNAHYESLDSNGADLLESLEKIEKQQIVNEEGTVIDMPDAAGLITTRAFMKAHAFKGSNRRLVEHSFKELLCSPITSWADINNPDDMVGQDVDRFPVGKNSIFQSTCKACHSAMDAYRPAFAHIDYDVDASNDQFSFIKYKFDIKTDPDPENPGEEVIVPVAQRFIPTKFRRNKHVYPPGFLVTNENWFNYNLSTTNINRFGWRSPAQGQGMKDFGTLLAESKAFSRCMAQKVYKKVCRKDRPLVDDPVIEELADSFEENDYSIRELTVSTALRPDCFGIEESLFEEKKKDNDESDNNGGVQ